MDDDDMFIRTNSYLQSVKEIFSGKKSFISGQQYLPHIDTEAEGDILAKLTPSQLTARLAKMNLSKWEPIIDFSGYTSRYQIVGKYFLKRKYTFQLPANSSERLIASLEDTQFMRHLDSFRSDTESELEPFIYHRLWSTPTQEQHSWMNDLYDQLDYFNKRLSKFLEEVREYNRPIDI
jgi:hypothetical protein